MSHPAAVPPKFNLGCGDVRHWSLIVPVVHIIFIDVPLILLAVFGSFSLLLNPSHNDFSYKVIFFTLFNFGMILITADTKLVFGVMERDVVTIRNCLTVRLIEFMVWATLIGVRIFCTAMPTYDSRIQRMLIAEIEAGVLFLSLMAVSCYPVRQYLNFLKLSSGLPNHMPGHVLTRSNDTEIFKKCKVDL